RGTDRGPAHQRGPAGGGGQPRGAPLPRRPPSARRPASAMSPHPSPSAARVSDVQQLFSFPFMVNALAAGTIVAVLAAVVGWYMVLRRQSFAGHTLSVMAFPGAAGAAWLGLPAALGYYLACGAAALTMGRVGVSRGRGYSN